MARRENAYLLCEYFVFFARAPSCPGFFRSDLRGLNDNRPAKSDKRHNICIIHYAIHQTFCQIHQTIRSD